MTKKQNKEEKETREKRTTDEEQLKERFSKQLKPLMKDKTDQAFADEIGVSRQSVSFWRRGKRLPSAFELTKICQSQSKSADWLLSISDDKAYSLKDIVKLISQYTGLSNASVDMLHKLNDLGATDEISALNYLLERVSFYKDVLWHVRHVVVHSRHSVKMVGIESDDLSEEELAVYAQLRNRGYYQLEPDEAIKYLATSSGNAFAHFIESSIDTDNGTRSDAVRELEELYINWYLEDLSHIKNAKVKKENKE